MSPLVAMIVVAAGAIGAVVRHELTRGRRLHALHAVNVVGSLLLGVAVALDLSTALEALAVGGLGALTSFSTWMVGADEEAVSATGTGRTTLAGHVLVPALLAVAAAAVGLVGTATVLGTTS